MKLFQVEVIEFLFVRVAIAGAMHDKAIDAIIVWHVVGVSVAHKRHAMNDLFAHCNGALVFLFPQVAYNLIRFFCGKIAAMIYAASSGAIYNVCLLSHHAQFAQ